MTKDGNVVINTTNSSATPPVPESAAGHAEHLAHPVQRMGEPVRPPDPELHHQGAAAVHHRQHQPEYCARSQQRRPHREPDQNAATRRTRGPTGEHLRAHTDQ
jgi:hypothetical protein